jgi:uncharacterized protein YecT (DUF1311 family)
MFLRCALVFAFLFGMAFGQDCEKKPSNYDTRQCYIAKETKANAKVEDLVKRIAANYRSAANEERFKDSAVRESLLQAAATLEKSQSDWKSYQNSHCKAVELSWTTGSGAGTAAERCMYQTAIARWRQLRVDF